MYPSPLRNHIVTLALCQRTDTNPQCGEVPVPEGGGAGGHTTDMWMASRSGHYSSNQINTINDINDNVKLK